MWLRCLRGQVELADGVEHCESVDLGHVGVLDAADGCAGLVVAAGRRRCCVSEPKSCRRLVQEWEWSGGRG